MLSDILSLEIFFSLLFLLLVIVFFRHFLTRLRIRQKQGSFKKPVRFDRNLIVIGAGAGGLVTAYIAAAAKAKVTLIETHKMGGDCLNYGCIPSKALIKTARVVTQMRHASRYGLADVEVVVSFKQVMQRVSAVIRRIAPHDSVERYTRLGVEVLPGYGRLIDPWTVEITDHHGKVRRLSSRSIVLATGATPVVPALPGLEDVGYVTSDTLWQRLAEMNAPPQRLIVLGGGPIGCELAQSLSRLGAGITQVEVGSRLLLHVDPDVSSLVQQSLEADNVTVLTEHQALRCEQIGNEKYLIVSCQGQEKTLQFDVLLCAVGRVPRLSGYGLETLGIDTETTVVTNLALQTRYPHIFAVGDVAGPYQFTHTASHQAGYAAINALFGLFKTFKVD